MCNSHTRAKVFFLAFIAVTFLTSTQTYATITFTEVSHNLVFEPIVTSTLISGKGSAFGPTSMSEGSPNREIDISFSLTTSQEFIVDVELSADSAWSNSSYYGYSSFSIRQNPYIGDNSWIINALAQGESTSAEGDFEITHYWSPDSLTNSLLISTSLTLGPGNYVLRAYAAGDIESSGSFDFTVSSVPLPAGFWLFVSGLAALVGAMRRKSLPSIDQIKFSLAQKPASLICGHE